MSWWTKIRKQEPYRAILLNAIIGVLLVCLPPLGYLSYDLSYWFRPTFAPQVRLDDVAVIYAGDITVSPEVLGDGRGRVRWDHHARLLDRLTEDGARIVFYDFIFANTNPVAKFNDALAGAIKRNGKVILIAPKVVRDDVLIIGSPIAPFDESAIGSGHGELEGDVVRILPGDFLGRESAVWLTAMQINSNRFQGLNQNERRWLNYYGQPPVLGVPYFNFEDVLSNSPPAGYFKNKIVFVGGTSPTEIGRNEADTFATPYSLRGHSRAYGVAIHATALENLLRDDWLRQVPFMVQVLVAILIAGVVTLVLYGVSRRGGTMLAVTGIASGIVIVVGSQFVQWHFHWWWSWLGPAVGQTSVALAYVWFHRRSKPVFISYRNEEDGATALLIAKSLSEHGQDVFIDVRSLQSGYFDDQLLKEIESASFFIVILSARSLERCVNPDDWVLRELRHALAHKKPIIPILKPGFSFDAAEGVPNLPEIQELRRFQGATYSNTNFDGFIKRLVELLKLPV